MKINYWRLSAVIIISLYFFNCISHLGDWHFIDNVDLIIHEAGHMVFMFFGQFISVLGGSFLQILIPVIFFIYFFLYKEFFSASIVLYWVGYNIINVSVYVGDAVLQQLPLLGGDSVIHDWNYLLSELHLLQYTHTLSSIAHGVGVFIVVIAMVLGLRYSVEFKQE